ncbi:MAG: hypothetical protein QM763_17395 [Agriterribacter sp.]
MKYLLNYIVLIAIFCLASCLKKDLPEVTNASLNNITDFNLLYKYEDVVTDNAGTPNENTRTLIKTQQLNKTITISNDSVYIQPGFPSGFPLSQKSKVSLTNIWGYANIPDAAIVEPVNDAPRLGTPGDYSKPVSYDVIAANGDKKRWVISVAPLPLVNQWEGDYLQVDTLWHATAGEQVAPEDYTQSLFTENANTLKATAGLWYFNNTAITYFIVVNNDNSVTVTADPLATVVVEQDPAKPSAYDPVNKRFDLYYFYYSGGNPANWRNFHTIFTLKP